MAVCHGRGRSPLPHFIVTPYVFGAEGKLAPAMPVTGPCGLDGGKPCRLSVHHWRARSTGPCFPLAVVGCATHGRAFTLYPAGHVPYGRKAIGPVAPDGVSIRCPGEVEPTEAADGCPAGSPALAAFKGTVFEPALDAAQGRPGDRPPHKGSSDRWWSVQQRRLGVAVRITGVAPVMAEEVRQAIAFALGVAFLVLSDEARRVVLAAGFRSRGTAVVRVLAEMPGGRCMTDRLVFAGYLAGLWPEPVRFDPVGRSLRRMPFRTGGTRDPPGTG